MLRWPLLPFGHVEGHVSYLYPRSHAIEVDLDPDRSTDFRVGDTVIIIRKDDYLKLQEELPDLESTHIERIIIPYCTFNAAQGKTLMAIDITDFLNESVASIQPPITPPDGHYIGQVRAKTFQTRERDGRKIVVVDYDVALLEPCEDVPIEELASSGNLRRKDGTPLSSRYSIWLDPESNVDPLHRLRKVLERTCAFDPETTTKRELLDMLVGQRFRFQAVSKPGRDGDEKYLNLTKLYAIGEHE